MDKRWSIFAGTSGTTIDLSTAPGWGGIVPDDAAEIYVTVVVSGASPAALQFYGDNPLGGVSFFGTSSGVTSVAATAWIPVSSEGIINVNNTQDGTWNSTELYVHGVRMR